jgi:hypothetical protein
MLVQRRFGPQGRCRRKRCDRGRSITGEQASLGKARQVHGKSEPVRYQAQQGLA